MEVWAIRDLSWRSALLGVSMLLLATVTAVTWRALYEYKAATGWVNHTYEVLTESGRFADLLANAEADERDYLLFANPSYNAHFDRAVTGAFDVLARLKQLTSDNRSQQVRLDRLERLTRRRLNLLSDDVSARKAAGLSAVLTRIDQNRRLTIPDEITAELSQIDAEETGLLRLRSRTTDSAARMAAWVTTLGGGGLFAFLTFATFLIERDSVRRRHAESALRESDLVAQRWKQVFENAAFGLSHTNAADNTFLEVNETFARQRGYRRDELPGQSILKTYTPDESALMPERLRDIDERGHLVYETEHVRKDGSSFPVLMDVTVIRDRDGKPRSRVSYARDITQERTYLKALRESEEQFRATFEQAAVGIAHVSLDGRWLRVNQRLCDLLGYSREELMELTFADVTHEEDLASDWDRARALVRGELDTYSMEKRYIAKNGYIRWANLTVSLLRDAGGEPVHFISVIEDIEARKDAEAALRNLAATLEVRVEERTQAFQEANRELEAFAYSVSHDLRAPLRTMQGFSHALMEDYGDSLPAQARLFLSRIAASALRMDDLIQDLLSYSRLSRSDLSLEPIDLNAVLGQVIQALEETIAQTHTTIEIDSHLPVVQGHYAMLSQVFSNLISNAIKFVSPGQTPHIEIRAEPRDGCVRVYVEDNGIGIEPAHYDRVFEVFQRLHGSEEYPGTGIGLAIVRRGAQRMGGSAGVAPREGGGSRFWVEFRLAEVE